LPRCGSSFRFPPILVTGQLCFFFCFGAFFPVIGLRCQTEHFSMAGFRGTRWLFLASVTYTYQQHVPGPFPFRKFSGGHFKSNRPVLALSGEIQIFIRPRAAFLSATGVPLLISHFPSIILLSRGRGPPCVPLAGRFLRQSSRHALFFLLIKLPNFPFLCGPMTQPQAHPCFVHTPPSHGGALFFLNLFSR